MYDPNTGVNGVIPPSVHESLTSLLAFLAEPCQALPPTLLQDRDLVRSWLDARTGRKSRFALGRVCATPGALREIPAHEIHCALARHQAGDWGNVDAHDWQENDRSLREGYRLLSAYQTATGMRFWVITEADRSVTTTLLPDEY